MGVLDTAMNAVYLDLAPQNAVALVSLGNGVAGEPGLEHLDGDER